MQNGIVVQDVWGVKLNSFCFMCAVQECLDLCNVVLANLTGHCESLECVNDTSCDQVCSTLEESWQTGTGKQRAC